jgi:hypothetical protein
VGQNIERNPRVQVHIGRHGVPPPHAFSTGPLTENGMQDMARRKYGWGMEAPVQITPDQPLA